MLLWMGVFGACRTESKIADSEEIVVMDSDGDGFAVEEDCDDDNERINPQATEICDGIDNNCDGNIDEGVLQTFYLDSDEDGFGDPNQPQEGCELLAGLAQNGSDCDDNNASIFPGNDEICDGFDNDCNDIIDDDVGTPYFVDQDQDGFGDETQEVLLCEDTIGYATVGGDCNDRNEHIYPQAPEMCDERDNDCNGTIDDGGSLVFYADVDSDGFGDVLNSIEGCLIPEGYTFNHNDCNDLDSNIHPLAQETCNEIDDNCNLLVDEGVQTLYYADADLDSFGSASSTVYACTQPSGYVLDDQDCDDADNDIHPDASEVCNDADENCNGVIDEGVQTTYYFDGDQDGWGDSASYMMACTTPSQYVVFNGDCDDADDQRFPGQIETCDGIDNNCNSSIDEGVEQTFYFDDDEDGYGDEDTSFVGCTAPSGYTETMGDCDDLDALVFPNAPLGCDGVDYNCDGLIDNDSDLDGYSDGSCGGLDCDDSDPSTYNTCIDGTDCKDILDQGLSTGDGIYEIDVDGVGGEDPISVYCDMTNDGGGWTLAMRFAGSGSQFTFNSSYWTDTNTLNESDLDPAGISDAKYETFSLMEADAIRGCMSRGSYSGCKSYTLPQSQTLYSLFVDTPIGSESTGNGLFFSESSTQNLEWLSIIGITQSDLTTPNNNGYIRVGINIDDDLSCYDARIRFGLALNNQSDVYTLNDTSGFGASAYYSSACTEPITYDSPWSVGAGFVSDAGNFESAGTIWVQ